MTLPVIRWALEWRSENRLDGKRRYFIWGGVYPPLFQTRKAALSYIAEHYGYIAERPDLQAEPHGWQLPCAVKVRVQLEKVARRASEGRR